MSERVTTPASAVQQEVEELTEQIAVARTDIEDLQGRADASDLRANASEQRLRAIEDREAADGLRLDALEERSDVDQAMIAELQASGLISHQHAEQLQVALRSSRTIGAALGIVMASMRVDEAKAFEVLSQASQHHNLKLRILAEDIVVTGDLARLRPA